MEIESDHKIPRIAAKEWQCPLLEGRYQLQEGELGKGSYGAVYKAVKMSNGETYALKKMENFTDALGGFPITTLR